MIQKVSNALLDPIKNRLEIQSLVLQLCNYSMNPNCSSCISDAVMLLSKWLKDNGITNDYFNKAIKGKYELKKINLFIQVYNSDNSERQKELEICLEINKSLHINSVPYFNVIEIKERLTFKEVFELTKNYPDHINIISNSDIYFDETILACRYLQNNECFALSRWDYSGSKAILLNRKDAQDVWAFNGSVNCNGGNYNLGIPGCDNRLAMELKESGYNVLNPSKSIHCIHLHNTNYRTYTPQTARVEEPYHFILPHY